MTLGSHQTSIGKSQAHFTPKWILDAHASFDMDPCAGNPRPWDCATENFIEADDGLSQPWHGRIWLNPPFDRRIAGAWVQVPPGETSALAVEKLHAGFDQIWVPTATTGTRTATSSPTFSISRGN